MSFDSEIVVALTLLSAVLGIVIGAAIHRAYIRRLIRSKWTGNPQSLLAEITQDRVNDTLVVETVADTLRKLSARVGGQADELDKLLIVMGKSLQTSETLRRQLKFSVHSRSVSAKTVHEEEGVTSSPVDQSH